jgi:hypothetical protein
VKLTTHLHLVPWSRTVQLYPYCPIGLHSVALNSLSTETKFIFFTFLVLFKQNKGKFCLVINFTITRWRRMWETDLTICKWLVCFTLRRRTQFECGVKEKNS